MQTNRISDELLGELTLLLGSGKVRSGSDIGADYTHDELPGGKAYMPEALVEASCTEDLIKTAKFCFDNCLALTARGAGTGKAGGSVPINGGVVLSTKNMNAILSFNEDEKTITVQPGVLLQSVKDEAAKYSLCYPPDPGEKTATIGGNAATDAGGPSALKYGSTKDYIVDAELVFADGSVHMLSEREDYKSVIGSEGTLAIITQLCLRLIEKPAKDVILLLPFMDAESCISAGAKIIDAGFEPAIMEYLDTDLVEFSGNVTGNPVFPIEIDGEKVGATMMLTIEGDSDDELDESMEAIAELAEDLECLDILVVDTPTLKRETWAAHDAFHTSLETVKNTIELNLSVPTDKLSELVSFAKNIACEHNVSVYCYAHISSGGLHIHAVSAQNNDFRDFSKAIYDKCSDLGGDNRGEYGFGYAKKEYICSEKLNAHKVNKEKFDSKGILNPAKLA